MPIRAQFEHILFLTVTQATGLNGAFLITFSAIDGLQALNREQPILQGEKPAFIFPFSRRIAV
jgi:hypothetical protein